MCLFVIAHRAHEKFPLVIAANRDEDYERPTVAAAFWEDEPDVIGGRDVLHGGSWLAMNRRGRFAAVTNLRGSRPAQDQLSRGGLVAGFVTGNADPLQYVDEIASHKSEYAGFHLVAGIAGADAAMLSGASSVVEPGVHGLSNAEPGVRWPKVELAEATMRGLLASASESEALASSLLEFLALRRGGGEVEREVFIAGDRYGTRSSTVIVVSAAREVLFIEQQWARAGAPEGASQSYEFRLTRAAV